MLGTKKPKVLISQKFNSRDEEDSWNCISLQNPCLTQYEARASEHDWKQVPRNIIAGKATWTKALCAANTNCSDLFGCLVYGFGEKRFRFGVPHSRGGLLSMANVSCLNSVPLTLWCRPPASTVPVPNPDLDSG